MIRILKAIGALLIVGGVALAVFSYLGDLDPGQAPVSRPVVLDVN